MSFKAVAISDTHGEHAKLIIPPCDFLFHTGDWTIFGDIWEVAKFAEWFRQQPATHKVIIAGNHDKTAQNSPQFIRDTFQSLGIHYVCCNEIVLDGIRIWGAPYTPKFNDWAFNMHVNDLHLIWDMMPTGLDVLLTHGPAQFILDEGHYEGVSRNLGDKALREAIMLKKPRYHLCGHIHGIWNHTPTHLNGTMFIN